MKEVINCFQEKNPLINKPLREVSVEEGMEIATELFEILNKRKDGIGLAANQVGIDAQVAVVNVREPIILINPKYVSKGNEIPYYEGCLSFKGKAVNTKRYDSVIIKTEQEGLLKTDPFPPKEEIQKYYKAEEYFSHNSKSGGLFAFFYRLFRAINFKLKYNSIKHLLNQGSLLDFGCGEGYFLKQMNNKGYSCYGVDPFRNKSKKISQSIFEEELSDVGFKTITAWHSIEHVYDLEKTIIRFHDVLSENGLVVVAVPNHNSYDAKYYKNFS